MSKTPAGDETWILNEVAKVFQENGFASTSMTDLVNATGINRANLYSTYGSKHHIYLRALEHSRRNDYRQWKQVLDTNSQNGHTLAATLTALIELVSDGTLDFTARAAMDLGDDPATARRIHIQWNSYQSDLADLYKRASSAGELADDIDHNGLAAMTLIMLQGLRVVGRADDNSARTDIAVRALLDLLARIKSTQP